MEDPPLHGSRRHRGAAWGAEGAGTSAASVRGEGRAGARPGAKPGQRYIRGARRPLVEAGVLGALAGEGGFTSGGSFSAPGEAGPSSGLHTRDVSWDT